jgi:hypothetical protein
MMDNVLIEHYVGSAGVGRAQGKQQAAGIGMAVLRRFTDDLLSCTEEIQEIRRALDAAGYPLSEVRILEILVWTAMEPMGYYRTEREP